LKPPSHNLLHSFEVGLESYMTGCILQGSRCFRSSFLFWHDWAVLLKAAQQMQHARPPLVRVLHACQSVRNNPTHLSGFELATRSHADHCSYDEKQYRGSGSSLLRRHPFRTGNTSAFWPSRPSKYAICNDHSKLFGEHFLMTGLNIGILRTNMRPKHCRALMLMKLQTVQTAQRSISAPHD
jgi:hypothetical protein